MVELKKERRLLIISEKYDKNMNPEKIYSDLLNSQDIKTDRCLSEFYDSDEDVLYLSVGTLGDVISTVTDDCIVWRFFDGKEIPDAVTIIDFKLIWNEREKVSLLSEIISSKMGIPAGDVEETLNNIL